MYGGRLSHGDRLIYRFDEIYILALGGPADLGDTRFAGWSRSLGFGTLRCVLDDIGPRERVPGGQSPVFFTGGSEA